MTVRGDGDTFITTQYDLGGRKLQCITIDQAALMANDVAEGVSGSLVNKNEEGIATDILPLSGEFHDEGNRLSFGNGKFYVLLDSDDCNLATQEPLEVNNEDTAAKEGDDGSIRKLRGLSSRTGVAAASRLPQEKNGGPVKRADVLLRNRAKYTATHAAIKEGRRLGGPFSVEVKPGGEGCPPWTTTPPWSGGETPGTQPEPPDSVWEGDDEQ